MALETSYKHNLTKKNNSKIIVNLAKLSSVNWHLKEGYKGLWLP